jgi:peptidase S24-like protein
MPTKVYRVCDEKQLKTVECRFERASSRTNLLRGNDHKIHRMIDRNTRCDSQSKLQLRSRRTLIRHDCSIYFWECAGLHSSDLKRVLPAAPPRPNTTRLSPKLKIIHAGASQRLTKERQLVVVPLLPVQAGTHATKGDGVPRLDQVPPETMLAAPSEWCPNPAFTSCLRVKGNSMAPSIQDDYIIAVDAKSSGRSCMGKSSSHGTRTRD